MHTFGEWRGHWLWSMMMLSGMEHWSIIHLNGLKQATTSMPTKRAAHLQTATKASVHYAHLPPLLMSGSPPSHSPCMTFDFHQATLSFEWHPSQTLIRQYCITVVHEKAIRNALRGTEMLFLLIK